MILAAEKELVAVSSLDEEAVAVVVVVVVVAVVAAMAEK